MKRGQQWDASQKRRIVQLLLTMVVLVLVFAAAIFGMRRLEKLLKPKPAISQEDDRNLALGADQRKTLTYGDKTYYLNDSVESYLIIGTDISAQFQQNQELVADGYVADMADAVMLLVTDKKNASYTVLQLDRNTITEIPVLDTEGTIAQQEAQQLCTAFFYGHDRASGSENTVLAVSNLLQGVTINGYAAFTMDAIRTINHVAGGVTVTLEDDLSKLDPAMVKGATITLSDEQAYAYVHERMNADDGTNLARMSRHRSYLVGLKQRLKEKIKDDGNFPQTAYEALSEQLTTNLDGKDINTLAGTMLGYTDNGMVTLEGETKLGEVLGDGIEHEEFYPSQESITETVLKLFYTEQ